MKLIVAGSRTIKNKNLVLNTIDEFHKVTPISEIVSGCASGPDTYGEIWADKNKIPIKRFPPKWASLGNAAGPIRNKEMSVYADYALIFWDGESKGSINMIENMEKINKPYKLIRT